MRKYLQSLPNRSEAHKRHFAFLTSGIITLIIFTVWTITTFGPTGTIADNNVEKNRAHPEISPLESLRANAASGAKSIRESFDDLKAPIQSVDLGTYGE